MNDPTTPYRFKYLLIASPQRDSLLSRTQRKATSFVDKNPVLKRLASEDGWSIC
jgi:hypothetical protein